jgi:predicted molibdopterin-dependent oxidoreductase YjgC
MKQKDMNMIMAAVAVLVMLKTMVNRTFHNEESEDFEDFEVDSAEEFEVDYDESPNQITDDEYEYLNELLEDEDFDFQNFKIEDFEHLDFKKLMTELSSNLEVKFAIMKNSSMLDEALFKNKNDQDSEAGEAVSDY